MKTIKHSYPNVTKVYYTLSHEVRTSKTDATIDIYRVDYSDNEGNPHYAVFKLQDSAIDFIMSNL